MKIAIDGTGYVGLSNAVLLAQHNEVVAIDVIAKQFEVAITKKINKEFSSRRVGDLPVYYANINKSAIVLNWSADSSLKCNSVMT